MITKKPQPHRQYQVLSHEFDAYNKETPIQQALGSERQSSKREQADIRSVNWVPGASGWRLTPRGLELGAIIDVFPPNSITFNEIQQVATTVLLGRETAGDGVIEQLGVGVGLSITGGELISTITQYTDEMAQDAVGGMVVDTATIDLTYTDGTPSITADIIQTYRRKSLFDHFASVGNVDTGEDDLYSDTIAAGQLANNGEKLEVEYGGAFVSSGTATRQLRIYFGGTAIFDSGALTLSLSSAWTVYASIIRVSSTVVRYMVSMTTQGAALAAYTAVGEVTGLTLSSTNVLKITGEAAGVGAATDDIVAKLASVQWLAAA